MFNLFCKGNHRGFAPTWIAFPAFFSELDKIKFTGTGNRKINCVINSVPLLISVVLYSDKVNNCLFRCGL